MKCLFCSILFGALLLPAAELPGKPVASADPSRYSRERLEKLRASLAAQIAVFDATENAMRAPAPAEASALAAPAAGSPTVRQVPGGGIAISGPQSGVNFLVVRKNTDGSVSYSHSAKPAAGGPRNAR
jgi:hypothetical protein